MVWPESTRRLARYKKINKYYKKTFLRKLEGAFKRGEIKYHLTKDEVVKNINHINWVVNNDWPTENTEVIETYLAKYINRSAVSKKRLHYNSDTSTVEVIYKDYCNQVKGQPAPYLTKKLSPLKAIEQILQHKLPPHFHRVRYYGLHHSAIERKVKSQIDQSLLRNKDSVAILFELMTKMLKQTNRSSKRLCPQCGHDKFDKETIAGDPSWIYSHIVNYGVNKAPPKKGTTL